MGIIFSSGERYHAASGAYGASDNDTVISMKETDSERSANILSGGSPVMDQSGRVKVLPKEEVVEEADTGKKRGRALRKLFRLGRN